MGSPFDWKSESGDAAPPKLSTVDDRLNAHAALAKVRRGEFLLHEGDFHNAKQLLGAMGRRLPEPRWVASPLAAFRAERQSRQLEHETLSRIVVKLDKDYALQMGRAPDVSRACKWVWGPPTAEETVVPLKQLLGMLGAAEWRKKGLEVPGVKGKLHPHYGVYLPTRNEYVQLVSGIRDVKGKTVFDLGTGTGVLSIILLQKDAASVVATDIDTRSIACATENAIALGYGGKFRAVEADLFPEGKADIVISNPPWIPEPPKNRVDRAVFDEDNRFLKGFLHGLPSHLNEGGRGYLVLSDLAVLLGVRERGWLEQEIEAAGLNIHAVTTAQAKHGKAKDPRDPLHMARSQEVTSLYCLTVR